MQQYSVTWFADVDDFEVFAGAEARIDVHLGRAQRTAVLVPTSATPNHGQTHPATEISRTNSFLY